VHTYILVAMKFCPRCESYLISEILSTDIENDPNKLLQYNCMTCGYKERLDVSKNEESKCIYKSMTERSKIKIDAQNLRHLKYDRTLPHITNIACPNEKCPTKHSASQLKNNVLYMNLNENMMIFLYQCCHCEFTWTNK
jgi:DNA-directed RNA polymerase subunit M/transcription elongation factor TFIIS